MASWLEHIHGLIVRGGRYNSAKMAYHQKYLNSDKQSHKGKQWRTMNFKFKTNINLHKILIQIYSIFENRFVD